MTIVKTTFAFIVLAWTFQLQAQAFVDKVNPDSTRIWLHGLEIQSTNVNSLKDFTIKLDSSYMEILLGTRQKVVLPIALADCINFEKFDSIGFELQAIDYKQKALIIKCYMNELKVFSNKQVLDLIKVKK